MILGICGSPREETTSYVLNKSLDNLKEKGYETKSFEVV